MKREIRLRLVMFVLAIVLVLCCMTTLNGETGVRRFNVRDSLEMTTFSSPSQTEPHPKVCISPDGSGILIVTSRGNVTTDEVRSDLLLYDTGSVEHYVAENSPTASPKPLRLASISAVPRAYVTHSYASLITELRWSPDSRRVYFLGQQSDGSRRLYQVGVSSQAMRAVSPQGVDVRQFDINAANVVVFLGGPIKRPMGSYANLSGININRDARVVTGLSLQQILFPEFDSGVKPRIDGLWLIGANGVARNFASSPDLGGPDMDLPSTRMLALSPNGRYVVCVLPLEKVPTSWNSYDPMPLSLQPRIEPADPAQTSVFNFNRTRSYFSVDTKTGRRKQLVDAPIASSLGYHDRIMALWSRRSEEILITNTFLPQVGSRAMAPRRQIPCAAAWMTLSSGGFQCLAPSRDQSAAAGEKGEVVALQLIDAHIGEDSNNPITLEFESTTGARSVVERYTQSSMGWKGEVARQTILELPLSISIHQDLNTPPPLWARDVASRREKQLLDPNPQLRHVESGRASIYRWTDATGRIWEGGLLLPVGYKVGQRYPLVIQTHGFQPFEFLVDGRFPTAMAARPLASVGIVVLQMGYSHDHMLSPEELDDQLSGYRAAIDHLVSDGIVDRTRVGIIGFSRPAWHVESALEKAPGMFAAANLADGIDVGYMQYLIFGEGSRPLASQYEQTNDGQPFGKGLARWLDRAVPFHLDQVRTPIRIEAIGPASILTEWEDYSSLRQQGKPVDMIYFPYGQHILQSPLERLASQEGNVEWFCFWLLDDPHAAGCPAVPLAQLERWKSMRSHLQTLGGVPAQGGAH